MPVGFAVPPDRIFSAPHAVDNARLEREARALRSQRDAIRARLGITDGAPVILFCGKLIPKKQPLVLLDAYEAVRRRHHAWLVMAGDGATHDRIVGAALTSSLRDVDAIVLAQASMARVVATLPAGALSAPVFSSPESGVERAREVLHALA